jgi:hypothetical protein
MPTPTVVGVGAASATTATTTMTPGFPASLLQDDLLVCLAESVGGQFYTLPTGWAQVTGSPLNIDTTTCLTVAWRRFTTGLTAPAWTLTGGNHAVGRIIGIRGVQTAGNPWVVTPTTSPDSTVNTVATWPALTTTSIENLILFCIATGRDLASTANLGAMTGGTGLTTITERMDNWVATGTGGGIGLVTAEKLTAGTTGAPTATMGTNEPRAMMTLALVPAATAAAPPRLFMARPR